MCAGFSAMFWNKTLSNAFRIQIHQGTVDASIWKENHSKYGRRNQQGRQNLLAISNPWRRRSISACLNKNYHLTSWLKSYSGLIFYNCIPAPGTTGFYQHVSILGSTEGRRPGLQPAVSYRDPFLSICIYNNRIDVGDAGRRRSQYFSGSSIFSAGFFAQYFLSFGFADDFYGASQKSCL